MSYASISLRVAASAAPPDTVALTEDNELTMALKSLGALMISPAECTVVTDGEDFAESPLVLWRTEQVDKRRKIGGHDLDPARHCLQQHNTKALPG